MQLGEDTWSSMGAPVSCPHPQQLALKKRMLIGQSWPSQTEWMRVLGGRPYSLGCESKAGCDAKACELLPLQLKHTKDINIATEST